METEGPLITAVSDFLVGKRSHELIVSPSKVVGVLGEVAVRFLVAVEHHVGGGLFAVLAHGHGIEGGTPMGAELTFDNRFGIRIRRDGRGQPSRDKRHKAKNEG